jgi:pimeloyl-ACP methyl ester carboxylesterase
MLLNYIIKGKGKTLLLLHGNGEDATYFRDQIEYFSRDRKVVAVDSRGHGHSPRGKEPFTIRQFAEDIYEFIKYHKLGKVDVLGFSDGANVAMILAIKYPKVVDNLILNGGNIYGFGIKLRYHIPTILAFILLGFAAPFSRSCRSNFELLKLMVLDPHILLCNLRRIQSRTLVLVGTKDMIRDSHSRMIARAIPNAKYMAIEGNHFIAFENSAEYNQVVEQFLDIEKL